MEALAGARRGGQGRPASGGTRRGLVFVGFMGAGKSLAVRRAADELGAQPLDSDRELERRLGEPIESYFEREGEAAFRQREEQVVVEMLSRADGAVVALGGGALGSARVRDALRSHVVVHLEVEPELAWRRVAGRGRPLARDRRRFRDLHEERLTLYESVADATLPAGDRELPRRALPALAALAEAPRPGGRRLRLTWAVARSGEYPVFFGRGLLEGTFFPREGRRFVVTDRNVARHHRLPAELELELPPGEHEKNLARAEAVLRDLARAGARRDDLLVALGGGVVGDLAGFCAAVYQRGMPCVQVPTTLVAQVDSAYGGKTGVDLPEGKNYVGAYHQPASVLVDPAVLGTLPPEELAAGYAEVVKTALIAGGELWERVAAGGEVDDATILGCLRTKLSVVSEDERDAGRRQVLNLGHTVAHAIEAATGYRRYRHGEAVAVGLICALRLSGAEDLRARVGELLAERGLPLQFEGATTDEVLGFLAADKKRRGGRVPFVLVRAPGDVTPGHELDEAEVRRAVDEARAR